MKILIKALLAVAVLLVVFFAGGSAWFFLYSGDIPDFATVAQSVPVAPATVANECSGGSIPIIPALGKTLQGAIRAAEGGDDRVTFQISRRFLCNYHGTLLQEALIEYKAAAQLRRRFTPEQLLTIYVNRAYFGKGIFGVEAASQHFYGKHAPELNVAQAAMIAALIKSPSMYSPERHPEKAKQRRDEVLDAMVLQGAITTSQATLAKAMPVLP